MASPDVFLSSPSRPRRQITQAELSSSPELPSVRDLLSQKAPRPPLKSGSKAAPIPENATTSFTSAGRLLRSLQSETTAKAAATSAASTTVSTEEIDTSISAAEDVVPKRKPRPRKRAAPKRKQSPAEIALGCSEAPADLQPWKKYKSPTKPAGSTITEPNQAVAVEKPDHESMSTPEYDKITSRFFATQETEEPKASKPSRPRSTATEEPLHLEAAVARRMDWTPPAQKVQIIIDSDGPPESEISNSQTTKLKPEQFGSLLATFKCDEDLHSGAKAIPETDVTVLGKRKLIELLPAQRSDITEVSKPDKPAVKRKAAKKKPLTITALATSAYRPATEPELVEESEIADQVVTPTMLAVNSNKPTKPKKRTSKATKKKEPAPKPILLSPSTALKQVSRQDFVFGTSSQLAREQSPTLLRDLQAAMKASNQFELIEYTTPLNSDAIEAPERQQSLWGAGARDEDGDLFDAEVLDFADRSPGRLQPFSETDPFGYVRHEPDDSVSLPVLPAARENRDDDSFVDILDIVPAPGDAKNDDSFVNLSDILPAANEEEPIEIADDSLRAPNGKQIGESLQPLSIETTSWEDHVLRAQELSSHEEAQNAGPHVRKEQSFDLLTDAQLAKKVAQYGFKPIKKRETMIALLNRCGQVGSGGAHRSASPSRMMAGSSRAASTLSTATVKEKRPRGRPRKASVSQDEPDKQPPPSAQPCESPRRPRGRPRKAAESDATTSAAATSKKSTKKKSSPPTTPKRKAKSAKTVIEIPDSQSEAEEMSASPCSFPEPTFSPPQPVDLSVSVDEDTELSLTMSPTDQQSAMFSYMTKAVTTAPRTRNPDEPSWHEKILLYDPIVLEDLTAWLNSGQLTRVGWDGEASVGEVKKWCEAKSICCLWKVNLRGKERRRY
ncbi:hypothetical protein HIM_04569 [Hirsutella minnesotensis 3608]|uniref:Structure-specific endonuclease subunit SLX4 n=1 Tax=Hirsutella minnesotensis 3608 TaxID=1043627 RepID=A0A0F7ZV73_9HYPO|nr:hypothetical protein HIM_04569 [Hirsutella minnesotensis 3608]